VYWLQSYYKENAARQKADRIGAAPRSFNCHFAELDASTDPYKVRAGRTDFLSRIFRQKQIPDRIPVHSKVIGLKYPCPAQLRAGEGSDDKVYRATCYLSGPVPGIRRTLPQGCTMGD